MAEAVPLTKLEAVNGILRDMGDRQVSSLTNQTRIDVIHAIASVEDITNELCETGYWFNTEIVEIALDGSDQYVIPADYSHVEVHSGGPTSGSQGPPFLVVRGRVLYDTVNSRDTFAGSGSVKLKIHRLLSFEQMPATARQYVRSTASVITQSQQIGSTSVDRDLRERASRALAALNEEHLDANNIDQTYSPHFIDIMHRR